MAKIARLYFLIHFMCRLPTSIYKHTCKCAIKKNTQIFWHTWTCDKRCMWPLQHCSSLHGHLFSSLPICIGEWGGRGLWLESLVQWGVKETRGSGQNIDRYVINVSEPHIRTIMYESYFCSVWGVGFFYCREKNVLCICGSV